MGRLLAWLPLLLMLLIGVYLLSDWNQRTDNLQAQDTTQAEDNKIGNAIRSGLR